MQFNTCRMQYTTYTFDTLTRVMFWVNNVDIHESITNVDITLKHEIMNRRRGRKCVQHYYGHFVRKK